MGTTTVTLTAAAAGGTRGTVDWACREVEGLTGVATAGNALKHVQAGYERFLSGVDPNTDPQSPDIHTWSFLPTYKELSIPASAEGTCKIEAISSVSIRLVQTAAETGVFAATSVGKYVTVEDYGTFRIATYTDAHTVLLAVESGQGYAALTTAANFWLEPILDLPTDFAGLMFDSVIHAYSGNYSCPKSEAVSLDRMLELWRQDKKDDDGILHYSVVPKPAASGAAQAWQLWFYPRQTNGRVVRYRYHIDPTILTDSSGVYLAGGSAHWETILHAALADAELTKMHVIGAMEAAYRMRMAQSIAVDKSRYLSQGPISLAATGGTTW